MNSQSPTRPRVSTSASYLPVALTVSPTSSTESPLLPFNVRPGMSRHSTMSMPASLHQRSPYLTAGMPSTLIQQSPHGVRLLMPTVRPTRPAPKASPSSNVSSVKSSPAKSRSRAGSMVHSLQPSPDPSAGPQVTVDWIGDGCRFEVVEDEVELEGYQLYAVEKW